ncbi:MAG: CPBP family intramembrane metalloprotease [Candidatus Omnitrophota bacterium]|nr:CPBP family intramembrane metalloprotease [Candidatus Omnitrophota bacterium]
MNISRKIWLIFIILAVIGFTAWFKFSYPQFSLVDLSIDRNKASRIAESYLASLGVDTRRYSKAIVFVEDLAAERYLQKALGFKREGEFIKKYDYELFFWLVRFFKEGEKEEYKIMVSSKNGKVISFNHFLEDTQEIPNQEKELSKRKAKGFLIKTFGIDFSKLDPHGEQVKKLEKRIDYDFSWENKEVYIPWSNKKDDGGAKLIIGANIAGNQVRGFYKQSLDIPEKFTRFIERQLSAGRYIGGIASFLFVILIGWSIFLVVKRRNDLIMHISKRWYVIIGIMLFVLGLASIFNNFQPLIFGYNTSASLVTYLGNYFVSVIPSLLFISIVFILPGLAGESLRSEVFPDKKQLSFSHFIISTFWNRSLGDSIMLGYLLFFILIGLQSTVFWLGQKFLGVWVEQIRLVEMSAAYLPFLAALIIGFRASLNEEILFRLFGIGLGKRYLKNTALAVFFCSVIWGFGHSEYAVFPTWFRGIEVSLMGLLLGFAFLKFGLVVVIVAHYVFDVFWGVAPYILSRATPHLFISSLCIILLPLLIAVIAYIINGGEEERKLEWLLNSHQKFNLGVLISFLKQNKDKMPPVDKLQEELINHGWDVSVVEAAIKKVYM